MTLQFILIFQAIQAISLAIIAMVIYRWWTHEPEVENVTEMPRSKSSSDWVTNERKYRAKVPPEELD